MPNQQCSEIETRSDDQANQPTKDTELSFSALEEQDVLVQAFRHFLQTELTKLGDAAGALEAARLTNKLAQSAQ